MEGPPNLMPFTGTYEDLCQGVASSGGLVVLVFTADWCPPCKKLCDFLPTIATDAQNVQFLTANTDETTDLVSHYGVCSIPHVKFLKAAQGGQIQELASITGIDIPQMKAKIQQYGN